MRDIKKQTIVDNDMKTFRPEIVQEINLEMINSKSYQLQKGDFKGMFNEYTHETERTDNYNLNDQVQDPTSLSGRQQVSTCKQVESRPSERTVKKHLTSKLSPR